MLNINNMNKYKAGDRVKALVDYRSLKKGNIYEVRKVGDFGCFLWTDEEKIHSYPMYFSEIEPVTEYKKGDRVKALVDYLSLEEGEIYEMEEVREYGCWLWRDKEKTYSSFLYFHNIEPVITFEDFLTEIFIKDYGETILDDSLPDAESNWLVDLSVEDWLMYGNDYKNA